MGTKLLENRVALVTGASSGIGNAIALALAAAGAHVVAVGRDPGRLRNVVAQARPTHSIEAITCQLTDDDAVRELATRLRSVPGSLDILVHAAGDIAFGTVEEAPIEDLDRLMSVNLRAPYLLTQTLLPLLRVSRGHVVFVNSSAGMRPSAGVSAYGVTKHALHGFANALRDEINPLGVRVTSVFPGRTRTPMQKSVERWEGRSMNPDALLDPADVASMVVALLALPHGAEVTDLHLRPARPPRVAMPEKQA